MTAGPERQVDDRLADWVDGTLTGRERDRFVAELRVNAQLRQDLADYERTVAVIRSALQAPTHPTNLADRVFAAIEADRASADARRARGWWGRLTGGHAVVRWRSKGFLFAVATAAALLATAVILDNWAPAPATNLVARTEAVDVPRDRDHGDDEESRARLPAEAPQGAPAKADPGAFDDRRAVAVAQKPAAERAADKSSTTLKKAEAEAERVEVDFKVQAEEILAGLRRVEAPAVTPRDEALPERARPEAKADRTDPDRFGALLPSAPTTAPDAGLGLSDVKRGNPPASRNGAASPPGTKDAAPSASVVDPTAAAAEPPAADLLALVVLQGDATDGVDAHVASTKGTDAQRGGEPRGAGSRDAKEREAKDKASVGARAALSIDEFLTDQMRVAGTVRRDTDVPSSIGRVTIRAIEEPVGTAGGGGGGPESQAAKSRELTAGVPAPEAVERTWLVEGSQDDVAALLRNIAAFAKKRNLLVSNGEQSVVLPARVAAEGGQGAGEATAPVADAAPKGTSSGTSRAVTPTRILLRFRLLRR